MEFGKGVVVQGGWLRGGERKNGGVGDMGKGRPQSVIVGEKGERRQTYVGRGWCCYCGCF